jgi:CHASE3 domain sensor protein
MSWSDVAGKLVDFLERPNILGAVIFSLLLLFLAYVIPIGVMTYTSINNTERLETASRENTMQLKNAIQELGNRMERHSIAAR